MVGMLGIQQPHALFCTLKSRSKHAGSYVRTPLVQTQAISLAQIRAMRLLLRMPCSQQERSKCGFFEAATRANTKTIATTTRTSIVHPRRPPQEQVTVH